MLVNNAGMASWTGQGPTDGESESNTSPVHFFQLAATRAGPNHVYWLGLMLCIVYADVGLRAVFLQPSPRDAVPAWCGFGFQRRWVDFECVHDSAGEMEDWQKMMKLDLEVPMRLTRRLSPAMVSSSSILLCHTMSRQGLGPTWARNAAQVCCPCSLTDRS